MKALVLNGSPKGKDSNTMRLAEAFLKGAGWEDAERIEVFSANIKPCRGCFACWNQTPGKCVVRDDMDMILEKYIAADVVIWAFPLYYFSVPGGLKNLMDRQLPLNLPFMSPEGESGGHPPRYDLSGQRHAAISTCGFWTAKGNYDGIIATFNHTFGEGNYGQIFCGQGELFRVPELRNRTDAYLEIIRQAGKEFAAGAITEATRAAMAQPLYPRDTFERMADASWGIQRESGAPTDGSLQFTAQMAALYRPDGVRRVLELSYTDIGKTYQMLLAKDGAEMITGPFQPYTTRIETPFSLWQAIARGEISGRDALFRHQYKVLGDFGVILRWNGLFGGTEPGKKAEAKTRKTNMALLLAPWIVIWALLAVHAQTGAIAGIMAASLLPLAWLAHKPVVYEQISAPLVAGLSLCVLLGAGAHTVVPVSYGLFGLLWLVTVFLKIPLTAYYSANHYGGGHAFGNPLFRRTNRILTAAWGIVYLMAMAWTYVLMRTPLAAYTGLVNAVVPAVMGVLTAWFQRWYPAWWAKGAA